MRLFVAVNLPDGVRREIWEAATPLRELGAPVRWVPPDALHITLKFLGEVAPGREREIASAVESGVGGARRFALELGGFGAFPAPARPRVVWVGCEAAPPLELVQHGLETACAALGFPVEGRPFRPHVTLGRVAPRAPRGELAELGRALERVTYAGVAEVRSVDLMCSELSRRGARYTVRHAAELAA